MSNPTTVDAWIDYKRLRGLAQSIIQFESQCTLSATALVHELYLKFRSQRKKVSEDPHEISPQFAARMMKQILIDRARSRISRKRLEGVNGEGKIESENREVEQLDRLLDFEALLEQLANELPENAELVRLHVYSDLSIEECADTLEMSRATAYRKWQFSKGWLQARIK